MLCINKRLYRAHRRDRVDGIHRAHRACRTHWRDRAHRGDRSNRAHWRNRSDRPDRQRSSCGISERLLHTGPVRSQRFFADF